MNQPLSRLTLPDRELAYQQRRATLLHKDRPEVVFLSGFASDMMGTKASFLDEKCAAAGYGLLRFDYRGHGQSSGRFEEGCIGDWLDDTLQMIDHVTQGPQILVGSSMGGWLGLLAARARPNRIAGFVGLAAAPDFTEDLILPSMTSAQQQAMARDGFFYEDGVPEEFRKPLTRKLIKDGAEHLVLRAPLQVNGPVSLLQGQQDKEVPWQTALKIAAHLTQENVRVTLIKDGEHRLSRPQDLSLVWQSLEALICL